MVLKSFFLIIVILSFKYSFAQNTDNTSVHNRYNNCYIQLQQLLLNNGSFKSAVVITEDVFYTDSVQSRNYFDTITYLKFLTQSLETSKLKLNFRRNDSINFLYNYSIKSLICDSSYFFYDTLFYIHLPFRYSFTDPLGRQDWSNMFVTKLLATHEGNCHSLAYLYKILADEVGAKCWLSLAPNHIYIKNYSEKIGWYNTELTSGTFPTDAWVMVTGYVNPEAIKSGLYMDTLSNQQSIALCVLDLAKEYEFQTHNYYDGFILKCCDLVLQYHPVNPMALLLKAETLKKVWLKEREEKFPKPTITITEMQNAYITLAKLGYREMPEKMYQQWLKEMTAEKEKYSNKKVTTQTIKR